MKYKFTFHTVIEIEATNSVAARAMAEELRFGVGAKMGGDTSPSGMPNDCLNWKWKRSEPITTIISQEKIG